MGARDDTRSAMAGVRVTGERKGAAAGPQPLLGKSFVIHGDEGGTDFQELAPPIRPFGPAETEER